MFDFGFVFWITLSFGVPFFRHCFEALDAIVSNPSGIDIPRHLQRSTLFLFLDNFEFWVAFSRYNFGALDAMVSHPSGIHCYLQCLNLFE